MTNSQERSRLFRNIQSSKTATVDYQVRAVGYAIKQQMPASRILQHLRAVSMSLSWNWLTVTSSLE
jgi:hypothetical protein